MLCLQAARAATAAAAAATGSGGGAPRPVRCAATARLGGDHRASSAAARLGSGSPCATSGAGLAAPARRVSLARAASAASRRRAGLRTPRAAPEEGADPSAETSSGVPATRPAPASFSTEELDAAKETLQRIVKAGELVEEAIVACAEEGKLTEAVLWVTEERIKLAGELDADLEGIQGLQKILWRMQNEFMQRNASPALILLEEALQVWLEDGEDKAIEHLYKALKGGVEVVERDPLADQVVDIFGLAGALGEMGVEAEVKTGVNRVGRTEFVEGAQSLLDRPEVQANPDASLLEAVAALIEYAADDDNFEQ